MQRGHELVLKKLAAIYIICTLPSVWAYEICPLKGTSRDRTIKTRRGSKLIAIEHGGWVPFLLGGVWSTASVRIESEKASIKVFEHGGTHVEPTTLEGWNRKYCGWGVSASKVCEVTVSEFGWLYPFGRSSVVLQLKEGSFGRSVFASFEGLFGELFGTFKSQSKTKEKDFNFNFSCSKVLFDPMLIAYFAAGVILFMAGPSFSHSKNFHLIAGSTLGGVGFALILAYVLYLCLPGDNNVRRKAVYFSIFTGAFSAFYKMFLRNVTDFLMDNIVFIVGFMGLGASIGFYLAYTRPPSSAQKQVAFFFSRLLAIGLLLKGTNNLFASAVAVIALFVLEKTFKTPPDDAALGVSPSPHSRRPTQYFYSPSSTVAPNSRRARNGFSTTPNSRKRSEGRNFGAKLFLPPITPDEYEREKRETTEREVTALIEGENRAKLLQRRLKTPKRAIYFVDSDDEI